MATNGYPVRFSYASETAIYFEDSDLDTDNFSKSQVHPVYHRLIRSKDNKFLILNDDKQFQAVNLTTDQQRQPECKFNIQIYKDNTQVGKKGKAAMLYLNKGGNNLMVCCNDDHEIHPVEMDPPPNIGASKDKAVFYLIELPTSDYLLESSWHTSEVLGFDPDGPTPNKLVLRHKAKDKPDEGCQFHLFH